ncbi:S41 family peptidase [Planctomycetota bacterium]
MKNMNVKILILTVLIFSSLAGAQDRTGLALKRLSNKDAEIRFKAAEELGQIAPKQDQVIEALRIALSDKDYGVRGAAARALYRIGPVALEKADLMRHTGYDPIESRAAVAILENAWNIINAEYPMFVFRDQMDWDALREKYRAEAEKAKSYQEVGIIVAQMSRHLRDGHVWVKLKGKSFPVFKVLAELNVNKNTKIYEWFLGRIQPVGRGLMWAKTKNNIGWIMFTRWDGADLPDRFDDVMEQMRDTRGLIVDVRWNGGGDSELSKYIAARFADTTRVYGCYRYRNGPNRTDLTGKIEQTVSPRGPWRYDRPVILLMGQGCISACESFCAMMAACPNVTTMGDHTRGSTGFPVQFKLGGGIEIHVPQWIAYLPDGQVIDGHGVIPDVPFVSKPDSFTGDRDELLSMALERLRKELLPAKAIEGPTIQAVREREKVDRSYKPKVVSVEPSEGTLNVATDTELRVRFDKPMYPSTLQIEWKDGGFHECGQIRYDETKYEFTIPVHLEAGCQHRIVINPDPEPGIQKGFQSIYQTGAESLTWAFSTLDRTQKKSDKKLSANEQHSDTNKTRSVVERFNKKRKAMWAFVETIKTQEYGRPGHHGYQSLRTYTTRFALNGEREFCADIGEMTGMPLFVFSEGNMNHIGGYYRKNPDVEEIVFCHYEEIIDRNVVVADPFSARNMDVDSTIRQLCLQHGGQEIIDGKHCDTICSRMDDATSGKSSLPVRQWWIDQQSHLLTKMVDSRSDGSKVICRFSYDHINELLNFLSYTPNVSYQWVCENKKMVDPLEEGYSGRFIEVSDGTRGNMSAAWGRNGDEINNIVGITNNGG